jgi:hypothetical protein
MAPRVKRLRATNVVDLRRLDGIAERFEYVRHRFDDIVNGMTDWVFAFDEIYWTNVRH